MSIRPIEFNGIIQNSHEISQSRNQDEHKPMVNQANISVEVNKQQEQLRQRVNTADNADSQEYGYDREGNGSGYQGNQRKKGQSEKDKSKLPPVDGVTVKRTSSFDIKI